MAEPSGGVFISVPFGPDPDWRTGSQAQEYSTSAAERFLRGLIEEILTRAQHLPDHTFATVYFGGNGPSALSLEQLYQIIERLYDHVSIVPAEQTMLVVAGTVDPPRAKVLYESGFDRMELRAKDASRTAADFAVLRAAGFRSVGVEVANWSDALLALRPDHIVSVARSAGTAPVPLPALRASGYREYLPHHYCLPGHECRHLADAAAGADLVGFGPGAQTRLAGKSFANPPAMGAYLNAVQSGRLPGLDK